MRKNWVCPLGIIMFLAGSLVSALVICTVFLADSVIRNSYVVKEYIVQPGDTYDVLADRFSISEDICVWRERVKMINGRDGSGLFVGEKIYVYVARGE